MIVLFADDTTVYVQNNFTDSETEILNTELAKITLWFDQVNLPLMYIKSDDNVNAKNSDSSKLSSFQPRQPGKKLTLYFYNSGLTRLS